MKYIDPISIRAAYIILFITNLFFSIHLQADEVKCHVELNNQFEEIIFIEQKNINLKEMNNSEQKIFAQDGLSTLKITRIFACIKPDEKFFLDRSRLIESRSLF